MINKKIKEDLLRTGGLGLLILCCAFLISQAKVSPSISYLKESFGKYSLQSTGNLNQNLGGQINFESLTEIDRNNKATSIIKLKLDCEENGFLHSMEFLISKENASKKISKGSYLVAQGSRGFLKNFNGVFGFANINSLGELPFFAKSGKVQIDFVDDFMVKGMLNVSMRNANGKLINLEGDFIALK